VSLCIRLVVWVMVGLWVYLSALWFIERLQMWKLVRME
jgi:hypothetical protein